MPGPLAEPAFHALADLRDDAALLARARAGDRDALAALLARHAGAIHRRARARCGPGPDADDVAQDALLAAARNLARVREARAIPGWLRTTVRRACARRRRLRVGAPTETDPAEAAVDPGPGPERGADGRALRAALAALPDAAREVLVLRDVEGLTAPEVAEALGLRVETVKTRLHRARAALRDAISPSPRGPDCPDLGATFSRYLEGELDARACDRLAAHVATCTSCGPACAALRAAVGDCRTLAAPTPDLSRRIRDAIRRAAGA